MAQNNAFVQALQFTFMAAVIVSLAAMFASLTKGKVKQESVKAG